MIRLNTDRLEFVAATVELVQLELNQTGQLAQLITAEVPARWPPELFTHDLLEFVVKKLEKDPALADWLRWYWIKQDKATGERILIGVSSFTTPTSAGIVEIAYSVMEEFRGFGYATEAIRPLISWVFSHIEIP
jgi:RimJ/RimL family protein N-acetyltransferase